MAISETSQLTIKCEFVHKSFSEMWNNFKQWHLCLACATELNFNIHACVMKICHGNIQLECINTS